MEDLLDVRAFARGEELPLVLEAGGRLGEEDAGRLLDGAVTLRRSSTFSSSGTVHGSFSNGICQNSSYFSTGASRTSVFFAIALARAMSVATPATRLISSGVTTGLLAEAPDAAVDDADAEAVGLVVPPPPRPPKPPPPKRPPPAKSWPLRSVSDCERLRVKRMSA